jgi:hypothetical protein
MVEFHNLFTLPFLIPHWGTMLFTSIIIYLVFSFLIYPRLFEKIRFSRFLLVFFLCVFSTNVLVTEILSLLKQLNQPWLFLGIQTLICGLIILALHHWLPVSKVNLRSVYDFSDFHFSKFEILLVALISATFLGFFIIGITTPINNNDSLATHLPRIYYWLQQGSLNYWTTISAVNRYQLIYPINALIQGVWLFLLGHTENLFFLVQWFSLILIAASTFEISRFLGFSTSRSLVSTLIGLSLPIVLLQTFSYQGDLTVTALIMLFIVFVFLYNQTKNMKFIWLALFCIILSLGTKQTAFFILPIAGIVILYLLLKNKSILKLIKTSWLLIVLTLVFASFQYVQNIVNAGSLFGLDSVLNEDYSSLSQVAQKARYLLPRFAYQFIGVDGLPRSIQPALIQVKENIFKGILNPAGLDLEKKVFLQSGFDADESFQYNAALKLSEDNAWFGPFAFLLIPLATVFAFFSKDKLRRNYAFLCFVNSLLYLILLIVQRPGWDPYQGRYFILAIFPFIPLIPMLFPKSRVFHAIMVGILLPVSLLLIINTLFYNDSKPIITAKTQNDVINNVVSPLPETNGFQIFFKKVLLKITYPTEYSSPLVNIFEATYYDRLFYSNNSTAKDIEFINQYIPDGEPISTLIPRSSLEYALFGRNFTRHLYPITDIDDVKPGYFLTGSTTSIQPSANMKLLGKNADYSIFFKTVK